VQGGFCVGLCVGIKRHWIRWIRRIRSGRTLRKAEKYRCFRGILLEATSGIEPEYTVLQARRVVAVGVVGTL
jgi:hypothetical protein